MKPNIHKIVWRGALGLLLLASFFQPGGLDSAHAAAGGYTWVSAGSNAISYRGQISANGRFAVFESEGTNLVPNDINGVSDVFMRDLQLGTIVRVSVDAAGLEADGGGGNPSISADGHFVAFESGATNLLPGDMNGFSDIYVKDTVTGIVSRASLTSTGGEPNNEAINASISGDGRFVVFDSEADNLVPNDTNGAGDIFVRDMQLGTTTGVTVSGNAGGFDGSISLDGRFVVFNSRSTNFVPDDTNGVADVFVYSIQTGQIVRASVNSSGVQGGFSSTEPSISGDGRYVTFSTSSDDFTTVDTYGYTQLYVRDMQAGTTLLVSYKDGYAMVGESDSSVISADGRYIAFSFDDKGDGMPRRDLYIADRTTNQMYLAVPGHDSSGMDSPILPSISGDGRFLLFATSFAHVPEDTNGERDIYVREMSYQADTPPTIVSIQHSCSSNCSPADQHVDFLVRFSEDVTGVEVGDFVLTIGGGISGAVITAVSGAGSEYFVNVDTGTGDGTLRLDVVDDDGIRDVSQNPLGGAGAGNGSFMNGEVYVVNKNIAVVTSILRLDANPTANAGARFAVTFSESVTGVDTSDFILSTSGSVGGASLVDVVGAGNAYTVNVNAGSGDGTLRLDLVDDDSIVDESGIPLGGFGGGNGNFTTGESYTLDRTPPIVTMILRLDPDPTSAETVHFSVIFSEPVKYIDVSQFALTANGPTGLTIPELSIDASTAIVTVGTGTGNGTIQLSVVDDDSLVDAAGNPLGGVGFGNGNFAGPFYSISKKVNEVKTERLRSNGRNDGWILETAEDSDIGGTKNSTADTLRVGDDAQDRQYRSILHFPTDYLPDNAVITQAILTIKLQGISGSDPFTTHGNILVDLSYGPYGFFGPFKVNALQSMDFQSPASFGNAAIIQNNPVGGWYWAVLTPNAFTYINRTGITQLRLAFQLDDNDDLGADFLTFYSGDAVDQANRPHLLIDYYVP
ncbi:MAG: PD40 domain-containing protein [Anaerolineales bacterium]|nr:PD40 domain-containing protein [Anaerolineales bacterium]